MPSTRPRLPPTGQDCSRRPATSVAASTIEVIRESPRFAPRRANVSSTTCASNPVPEGRVSPSEGTLVRPGVPAWTMTTTRHRTPARRALAAVLALLVAFAIAGCGAVVARIRSPAARASAGVDAADRCTATAESRPRRQPRPLRPPRRRPSRRHAPPDAGRHARASAKAVRDEPLPARRFRRAVHLRVVRRGESPDGAEHDDGRQCARRVPTQEDLWEMAQARSISPVRWRQPARLDGRAQRSRDRSVRARVDPRLRRCPARRRGRHPRDETTGRAGHVARSPCLGHERLRDRSATRPSTTTSR